MMSISGIILLLASTGVMVNEVVSFRGRMLKELSILTKVMVGNSIAALPIQKNYLDSVQTGGKNLIILINDILDLSKIEAGKMMIHPEPVNLAVIVEELTQIFQIKFSEKGLEWQVEIAPDTPEQLLLDEVRYYISVPAYVGSRQHQILKLKIFYL